MVSAGMRGVAVLNSGSEKTSLRRWHFSKHLKEGRELVVWMRGRAFQSEGTAIVEALR